MLRRTRIHHNIQYKFLTKKHSVRKILIGICCISYFAGLIIGASNISHVTNGTGYFELFIEHYLSIHLNQSLLDIWQTDFLSTLLLLAILLFSALSCVGTPITIIIPGIRGMFTGLLTASLYLRGGRAGVLLNGLTFWVPNVCIATAVIAFSILSAESSMKIWKNISAQTTALQKHDIQLLCWRFLIISVVVLVICFLQAILIAIFGPLFH